MKAPRLLSAVLVPFLLAAPPARATTGELLTRFNLDVAPQFVVTDSGILAGLPAGTTALRVPKGTSVDLPIPDRLKDVAGHPYTLVLKIKITDDSNGWVCLANMPDSNDSDAMIYLHKDTRKVCIKQYNKSSVSAESTAAVQKNRWTVLAFAFGADTTTVYMDGDPIYSGSATLANSFADCYGAGDYILVGADNDGDDNPFYLADARIYDGAVAVADELPGTGVEGDPFRIASVADWELLASNVNRGMALGDDFPYYRVVRRPSDAIVRKDERGAPHLVVWEPDTMRYAELACAISHSAPFVLCSYLRGRGARIGVDVERRSWRLARLGRKFLSPGDRMLAKDDDRGDETVLWSFKESLSKLLGTGWSCGFRTISCVETAPGSCELTDAEGARYPGAYFWFGQHALAIVWDEGPGELPPLRLPPRPWWERAARARRLRALRRGRAAAPAPAEAPAAEPEPEDPATAE